MEELINLVLNTLLIWHRHPIHVARIVEVYELLQALDVAIMEELLWK
jgi:hypothetical protein